MPTKQPIIKYLDKDGEYHYATVKDIGDLSKLTTAIKTDLVSAINSIEVGTGNIPSDLLEQIQNIQDAIDNGTLNQNQIQQVIDKINDQVVEINKVIDEALENIGIDVSEFKDEYNTTIQGINQQITTANEVIETTGNYLENLKTDLSNTDINIEEIERAVNLLSQEIIDKVSKTEFDLTEATVQRHETEIKQNATDISQRVTEQEFSLATGRITDVESLIEQNANEIKSKITAQEMRDEIDKIEKYNPNLLRNTRDWESWSKDDDVTVSNDTYRNCHILVAEDNNVGFKNNVENLEIGKTYTISVWAKSNNSTAKLFVKTNTETIPMEQFDGDITVSSAFIRFKALFVAENTEDTIQFFFTNMSVGSKGYLAAAKLEAGINMSGWQDHVDDNYAKIKFNETEIKQTKNSIEQTVTSIERIDEELISKESRIKQTEDGVSSLTERVTETEGNASYAKSYIEQHADKIESSVSSLETKDIANAEIANSHIDNRNRILNSNFVHDWEEWTEHDSGFILSTINNKKMAKITRSGLLANIVTDIKTNYFKVEKSERIMFGFDFWSEDLSVVDGSDIIASLELYDLANVRVDFKNITKPINYINNQVIRIDNSYYVERNDIAKARLIFRLNRNGTVAFGYPMAQSGSIGKTDWSPAPEDAEVTNIKNETKFTQTDTEIALRATKTELIQATGEMIDYTDAQFKLANDNITLGVEKVERETREYVNSAVEEKLPYTYRTEVLTSHGNTFKNGIINTRLYAQVYRGGDNITDLLDVNCFRWTRISDNAQEDEIWNQTNFGGKKYIDITSADVFRRAQFQCDVNIDLAEILLMKMNYKNKEE